MLLPNQLEVEVTHPHQAFVRQTVRCRMGGGWGRGGEWRGMGRRMGGGERKE